MNRVIAIIVTFIASCATPLEVSDTEQEMRSQCWYGSTWWQCCLTSDDGTGECCRYQETNDDYYCWAI